MSLLNHYVGLLGCLLLMIAVPMNIIKQPRFSRRMASAIIVILIMIAAIPINDLAIVGYVRGVVSDLSITSMILLGYFITRAHTGNDYLPDKDKRALAFLILLTAILVYPFGLGLTLWDSYATGYGNPWLYSLLFLTVTGLYMRGRYITAYILLAGIMSYLFSILASQNLWDYLIDPIVTLVIIFQVAKKIFKARYVSKTL